MSVVRRIVKKKQRPNESIKSWQIYLWFIVFDIQNAGLAMVSSSLKKMHKQ